MDSIKSFKGYGRADDGEDREFRKKTRKRLILIVLSSVVLVAVIIGVIAGTLIHKRNQDGGDGGAPAFKSTPAASIKAVCKVTPHPDSCFSTISSSFNSTSNGVKSLDPESIFKISLRVAVDELSKLPSIPDKLSSGLKPGDERLKAALEVCKGVFEDAVDTLNDTISSVEGDGAAKKALSGSKIDGIKTWLTAALTDHETCVDAFDELNSTAATARLKNEIQAAVRSGTDFTSNSLAIAAKILGLLSDFESTIHRRRRMLLAQDLPDGASDGFPAWFRAGDRRLLAEANPAPDMTVAQDGSGTHKSIMAAVEAVEKKKLTRTVIYVKKGTYKEKVDIEKHKWNVMMYGDGVDATIVSGGLNFIDGTATFHTATFAVAGKGFMARDMKFENTAGAAKHQAVAFRSGSDESVLYRCSFDGFQDTLYAHSNRQFYRDCDVTGTIDFIFGNAAAVFQNCNIKPRQPLPNQFNTITAQGKKEATMNSAISIIGCTFAPLGTLTAATYLGRPWKNYSTTVVMRSEIGAFLHEQGWMAWTPGVDPPKTILYGEYRNTGPGADVAKRVNWAGYRASMTDEEAAKFTVPALLRGDEWLPATNVPVATSL